MTKFDQKAQQQMVVCNSDCVPVLWKHIVLHPQAASANLALHNGTTKLRHYVYHTTWHVTTWLVVNL